MRTLARLCAVAFVLAALPLQARTRVALVEPRDGAVLRGGTKASVDWSALELPREAEEWEAFLSVDGGRFYAYRITPHLDIDRRTFTFDVPNIATADARILIRVGDEHHEHELPLRASFSILSDEARALVTPTTVVIESERGEPARAGARGVIRWVEGTRAGEHVAVRSAERRAASLGADSLRVLSFAGDAATSAPSTSVAAPPVRPRHRDLTRRYLARSSIEAREGRDVLLVTQRLNI